MSLANATRYKGADRPLALIVALGVVMSMMVVFATPALAHHPVIDSYSKCLNNGTLGLVVRSKAWTANPDKYGNHDDVRLEVQVPGSSTWYEVGRGAYTPDNDRRFEVRLPADFEITSGVTVGSLQGQTIGVRAWITDTNGTEPGAGWYNDAGEYNTAEAGNGNADATMQLTLLDCEPPAPPSGWACVDGEVTFIDDASDFEGTLYDSEEAAAADPGCAPPPPTPTPPAWACVDGEVIQVDRTTYEGTFYDTEEAAGEDPGCSQASAATTFTIIGSCDFDEGVTTFAITGDLGQGLSLDVAGETIDVAGPFSVEVDGGGDYPYQISAEEGYVVAEGSPATEGTIALTDCTPPEEVAALILVTVYGSCEVDGDDGLGRINVTVSVPGGATVEVRDAEGNLEGILEDDGSITVDEGATYSWTASAHEGYEFPTDFVSTGSVVVETCSPVPVLPFTGLDTGWMTMMAVALLGAGITVVRSTRSTEE